MSGESILVKISLQSHSVYVCVRARVRACVWAFVCVYRRCRDTFRQRRPAARVVLWQAGRALKVSQHGAALAWFRRLD